MEKFKFICYGHANILSTHRNTIEFTKDKELSKEGDCIIGVNSDFDGEKLLDFIKNKTKIRVILEIKNFHEKFICDINENYNDKHEIVFRKTEFLSDRTLGINASKAAKDLDRRLVNEMKDPTAKMNVTFEFIDEHDK